MPERRIVWRRLRAALALLLVVGALETYLNVRWHRMMGRRTRAYVAAFTARRPEQARIVALGNSHAHTAFGNGELPTGTLPPDVTDAAYGSDGLREVEVKLRTLLARGVVPHYVVLQADDELFAPAVAGSRNREMLAIGADRAAYRTVYGQPLTAVKQWTMAHLPLTDVANRNLLFLALSEQIQRLRGTLHPRATGPGAGQTWARLPAPTRARLADRRCEMLFGPPHSLQPHPPLADAWHRILALCRANGIRVIGVRYPLSPELQAAVARRYDSRPVRALLQAAPPDTLLDYATVFARQPHFFQDPDHLSPRGATALRRRLLTDLRALPPPVVRE